MDRRVLLSTTWLTGAVMAFALPAHGQPAPNARPTGGSVVAGGATIATSATTTTIDQTTQRAAINWQSFNIGSQQTVLFEQPSSSAVALNRVIGPNPSEIAGRIDANGQVIITNQSGVLFYKGSQVNTAGLMVSAAGIGNSNFMAGRMVFDQAAKPNAMVVNQGSITVRQAGLAALVAPAVANSGVINARLGKVVLAGATKATLDLYGDGLMAIDVTGQVVQAPNGATALVTNTGIIRADGGTVQLTAQAADGVVTTLVNAGGKLQANTVGSTPGSIVLNGVGGSITVAGQLTAVGGAPGTAGGNIEVDGSGNVAIAQGARINASGQAGGGVVAIGTTLARAKGGRTVIAKQTAANVTVAAGATVAANATVNGNGGRIAVLSRGHTAMNGMLFARGGAQGGNGGLVETSGKTVAIGNSAVIDTLAPHGQTGMWLLDPADVVIANTGGTETPDEVAVELARTDETIQADNDITLTDPIITDPKEFHNLTFEAGRSILLNAGISLNGGNFTALANDSIDLPGTTALPDRGPGAGSISMAAGVTIDTSIGNQSIELNIGAAASNTGGGGDFVPGTISVANLTTGGGDVFALRGTAIAVGGIVNAGTGEVELTSTGAAGMTLNGTIITTDTVLLGASGGGGVTQDTSGMIAAGALGINATGPVSMLGPNAVSVIAAAVTGTGNGFAFRNDATPLTVGRVSLAVDRVAFIAGITTVDGRIALSTTNSGGITTNAGITVNQPIGSTGGEIDIAVAPGSGFTNNTDSTLDQPTAISSGGGNIVVLADAMSLGANSTLNAGTGTVVLGPATTGDNIVLGGTSSAGTLGLQTADLATVTAGMLQIGYRTEAAAASFTGNISVAGTGISLNPADIPALLLVTGATGGTGGTVTQTAALSFSAAGGSLGIIAGGDVTLNGANAVNVLAGFADNGSAFSYSNVGQLTVGALTAQQLGVAVDATTGIASSAPMAGPGGSPANPLSGVTAIGGGGITLATTTGDLRLTADVTASNQTVTLNADGQIFQTAGVITAGTLTGSSVHGATMTQDNAVNNLGPFTDVASDGTNGLTFTDGQALQTKGTVKSDGQITLTTTIGGITLDGNVTAIGQVVTLDSAGAISQPAGIITAATVTGGSTGGANMTQGNVVGLLGPFADKGGGSAGIAFTDAQALGTTGTVSSASGPITLTTTGTLANLALGGAVTAAGNTVTLVSTGTISQSGGVITAATVTGSSVGGTTLILANAVGTLGPFSDTGTGSPGLDFSDDQALATAGLVSSTGPITLTTTKGGMTLGGDVTANGQMVTLNAAGAIDQTGGIITAATLTGSSMGGATLTQINAVGTFGPFSDSGTGNTTGLSFTDGQALTTAGAVSSTGPLALTTTLGDLTLGGAVTATGNTVTLISAGTISQTGGSVTGATLTGSSVGGTTLTQGIAIGTLGPFSDKGVGSTGLDVTDSEALTTAGLVSSTGPVTLTTNKGGVTLGGDVTANGQTVTLNAAGAIDQTGGIITAAMLTGSSIGGATLTQTNAVGTFGPFGDSGTGNTTGLSFTDGEALQTSGAISSTGPLALTTTFGGLTLGGDVTATGNTVTLISAGTIGQTNGAITAATLTGSSVGGTTLILANAIDMLGPFTDKGAGSTGLDFSNSQALITAGLISSTGPVTLTTTKGGLTLGGGVTANGQTVTLDAAGAIDQTAGSITAATLTGSSIDGATLTQTNAVGTLGPFSDSGTGNTAGLSFTDGQALQTAGAVSSTGPLALTTTLGDLTLGGAVTATGNTVTLISAGTIGQTGGSVTGATLTGSSVGGATLTQGIAIGTLGPFSDTGTGSTGLTVTDTQALTTKGVVSSTGPLNLTTTLGDLTIDGEVVATGQTVTLISAGAISRTAGGIDAGTLTGSSTGDTTLAQGNTIGTLGRFTANGGSLVLFDNTGLTITGPIDANLLNITSVGRMTLAGDISTTGAPLGQQSGQFPATGGSTLQVLALETNAGSFAQFVQTGVATLSNGATLRIQLPATGGTASFANLNGPGANLVLALGNGTATGTMEVGGLLVLGTGGGADLAGSIKGVTTRAAAALGNISPAVDPSYTFNDCIIGYAVCGQPTPPLLPPGVGVLASFFPGPGLLPVPALPLLDLVVLVTPPLLTGELAPQDVVPPNISFEDY